MNYIFEPIMIFLVGVVIPIGVFVGIIGICCLYKSLSKSKPGRPATIIPRYTREIAIRTPLLQCPRCGAEHEEDDLFCDACGTQLMED